MKTKMILKVNFEFGNSNNLPVEVELNSKLDDSGILKLDLNRFEKKY